MKKKAFLFLAAAAVLLTAAGFVAGYFVAIFVISPKHTLVPVIDVPKMDQTEFIQQLEDYYRALVLNALQYDFSPNRIRDLYVKIDMDMSNRYGRMIQKTNVHNEVIGEEIMQEERNPQIDRITVSVNIDGTWKWKFDKKKEPVVLPDGTIEREYTPVSVEGLRKTEALIRDAIGYNSVRGYSVTVRNIPFDRTAEFKAEDAEYFRKKQIQYRGRRSSSSPV